MTKRFRAWILAGVLLAVAATAVRPALADASSRTTLAVSGMT